MTDRVAIRQLPTGVPGLDQILGGGLPEFSFNLIAGAPGSGKTTLAQQIMFALSGPDRPALYFTVVGEPPLKMLRYQQQFTFFDMARVNESVRYVNLSQEVVSGSLETLLGRIVQEVEATSPGVVIVDSFRTVAQAAGGHRTATSICSISCSNWPSGSQAGKRRRFSSASINPRRLNRIRSSPSRTDCCGSIKASIGIRWFARCKS